MTISVIAISF